VKEHGSFAFIRMSSAVLMAPHSAMVGREVYVADEIGLLGTFDTDVKIRLGYLHVSIKSA
jgi:hypothetical protein